ncbi:hypothetical protein TSMEX_009726, partial [Taenia solium]
MANEFYRLYPNTALATSDGRLFCVSACVYGVDYIAEGQTIVAELCLLDQSMDCEIFGSDLEELLEATEVPAQVFDSIEEVYGTTKKGEEGGRGEEKQWRTHHTTGPSRPVFFSPGLTASPTSQLRNRNATPNVGNAVSGAMLAGGKKTSPPPSTRLPHQRNDVSSPMYQLPKFVNSPPRNLEMSPKQKVRLNELRHEKATCEQLWRKNNQMDLATSTEGSAYRVILRRTTCRLNVADEADAPCFDYRV